MVKIIKDGARYTLESSSFKTKTYKATNGLTFKEEEIDSFLLDAESFKKLKYDSFTKRTTTKKKTLTEIEE